MEKWIEAHLTLPMNVSRREEMENSLSHLIGFVLGLIGLLYILSFPASTTRLGMIIFAISNIVMYGASSLYHALNVGTAKRLLRVVDHTSIYLLIAGSYTPILMYVGTTYAIRFTLVMWVIAALGIFIMALFWGRLKAVHLAFYLLMGWAVVFTKGEILPNMPHCLFRYILLGGITYSLGVIFYANRKIPKNHLIWHIFVLAASAFFFLGYLNCLL